MSSHHQKGLIMSSRRNQLTFDDILTAVVERIKRATRAVLAMVTNKSGCNSTGELELIALMPDICGRKNKKLIEHRVQK